MDKLLLISDLFNVSLDYLMKDQDDYVESDGQEKYFLNHQKIQDYIAFKKQLALRIAGGVSLIILSVNIPILIADTPYESLGAVGMLLLIALAVALLILTAFSHEPYSQLEKQSIQISFQD